MTTFARDARCAGTLRRSTLLVAVLLIAAATLGAQTVARRVIAHVDTLVRGSAGHIDSPSEVLTANGALYLLNAGNQVFVVDTTGKPVRVLGRDGAGPGELRQARSLSLVRGQVAVLNPGNTRVEMYDGAGTVLPSQPMPAAAFGGGVAIGRDGSFLVATNGNDSTRAELFDPATKLVRKLGNFTARAPGFDMAEMKSEIAKGIVPARMRASVLPVLGADGGSWLIGVADADVAHYDRSGTLKWTTRFDSLAEMTAIRRAFFADNKSEANANKLFVLATVVAARTRGDDLYMLLRMPESDGARIVVLDAAGRITSILEFPTAAGIRSFDLSSDGRTAYLLDYYGDFLLRARIGTR